MKRILLSSACIVGFAGAAAADGHASVSFNGDAEIGYNDDFDNGMFWSLGLTLNGSAALDNGLTASISGDVELNNATNSTFDGNAVTIDDLVISLSSETASLTFGDTAPAADALYSSPVTNMDADGFAEEGGIEDAVIIGRVNIGPAEVGVSYFVLDTNAAPDDDLAGLQVGANASFGTVDVTFGYQDSDVAGGEIVALGASTTFGGATVGLGYATSDASGIDSLGIQVGYGFGPVTATLFYVAQDTVDDNFGIALDYENGPITVGALYHDGNDEDIQVNVTYDLGNGLNLFAGYRDESSAAADEYFYIGGDYDLGGGGNLRVSFADADAGVTTALDELGAAEDVKNGTTVAVSFEF